MATPARSLVKGKAKDEEDGWVSQVKVNKLFHLLQSGVWVNCGLCGVQYCLRLEYFWIKIR